MLFWKMCRLTCVSGSVFRRCKTNRCTLLSLGLYLLLRLPLSPSSVFPSRPVFLLSARMHSLLSLVHTLAHSPVPSATPCSSSCLCWVAQAPLHHLLFSFSPASAPFVNRPVTIPVFCPPWSSWQQKLPPTPWIIHESVSVFNFDWRVPIPDLRQSAGVGGGKGRGGCIIGLQQRIGPPGQTSSHSYPITLIYLLQYFFKDIFVKLKDNAGDIVPFFFYFFFLLSTKKTTKNKLIQQICFECHVQKWLKNPSMSHIVALGDFILFTLSWP